ncbi:MAG: signal peptide peptidase SppA [Rhodothermales bacterium]|nr:signal peptide peptidase SppA [Rhodothermales bacterium]
MRFLQTVLANVIGTFITIGLFLFLGFLFILALASAGDATAPVPSSAVLTVDLQGSLTERVSGDPTLQAFAGEPAYSVHDLANAIRRASEDDRIEAIWLRPGLLTTDWASLEIVRRAIDEFSDSGKPILASSPSYFMRESEYYLASGADEVYLGPESFFEFNGFALQVTFYADLLDRLEIEPQVVRAGSFKSATEPVTQTGMSPENREQLSGIVRGIENVFVRGVAEGRSLSEDDLRSRMQNDAMISAQDAVDAGLIDGLAQEGDIRSMLADRLGLEDVGDLRTLSMKDYVRSTGRTANAPNDIAVVYIGGPIMAGDDDGNPFGTSVSATSGRVTEALRRARDNDRTRAVVVRVNSPGGFAPAADAMLAEIRRVAEDLPVVISMGGVAASGGYWVAAEGDRILAESSTLTGSIGVFSLFFEVGPFFNEKLGITFDQVATSPYADMFNAVEGFSAAERQLMQDATDGTYERFVRLVAEGRSLEADRVREIAEGRVWTGAEAVRIGLVDELGGLDEALEIAADMAELEEGAWRARWYPRQQTFLEMLTGTLGSGGAALVETLGLEGALHRRASAVPEMENAVSHLRTLVESRGTVQARMPFDIRID